MVTKLYINCYKILNAFLLVKKTILLNLLYIYKIFFLS